MDWLKKNLFLVTGGSVAFGLLGFALFFLFTRKQAVDEVSGQLTAQTEELKKRYATKRHVAEAQRLIAAKAVNMLRHYVDVVLPNGFKAQVVATSRLATSSS